VGSGGTSGMVTDDSETCRLDNLESVSCSFPSTGAYTLI